MYGLSKITPTEIDASDVRLIGCNVEEVDQRLDEAKYEAPVVPPWRVTVTDTTRVVDAEHDVHDTHC